MFKKQFMKKTIGVPIGGNMHGCRGKGLRRSGFTSAEVTGPTVLPWIIRSVPDVVTGSVTMFINYARSTMSGVQLRK